MKSPKDRHNTYSPRVQTSGISFALNARGGYKNSPWAGVTAMFIKLFALLSSGILSSTSSLGIKNELWTKWCRTLKMVQMFMLVRQLFTVEVRPPGALDCGTSVSMP